MSKYDPAAELREIQQAEQTRLDNLAEEAKQEEEEGRQLAALIKRLHRFLLKQGSPGMITFDIYQSDSTQEKPVSKEVSGWYISHDVRTVDDPVTFLALRQDGTLWYLRDTTTEEYSRDTTTHEYFLGRSGHPLNRNIIPRIAELLRSLGLEWNGENDQTTDTTPSTSAACAPVDTALSASSTAIKTHFDIKQEMELKKRQRAKIVQVETLINWFLKFLSTQGSPGLTSFDIGTANQQLSQVEKAHGWIIAEVNSMGKHARLVLRTDHELWVTYDGKVIYKDLAGDFYDKLLTERHVVAGISKLLREINLEREWDKWYNRAF